MRSGGRSRSEAGANAGADRRRATGGRPASACSTRSATPTKARAATRAASANGSWSASPTCEGGLGHDELEPLGVLLDDERERRQERAGER